jgi:Immunoglobulin domain
MKQMMNSSRMFKSLLLAALLAGPMLAFNAAAQNREDIHWAPQDIFTDGNGNQYAYWDDANNWAGGVVPVVYDPNQANTFYNAAFDNDTVTCVVTNDAQVGQLMAGFGGGGTLVITNGAKFQAGFSFGGIWTGIGFVAGPGTLIIGPGSDFTCASHLWVGQGTANQGTVIINGGTLHIPNGQLGVSWNGIGGTNYITITNGGALYMSQWSSQTLGAPGSSSTNIGIMDIEANSQVVITNNQLGYMNTLITNGQLIAFGGLGKISAVYNPSANVTILTGLAPAGSDTPVFSLQPSNVIVTLGGTATLTATASPATGYQWLFNSAPLADGNGISGSKTATLTVANFNVAETGIYSVVATNSNAASQNDRNYASSQGVSVTGESFTLYPVVTINGVNGNTYVVQYATSLTQPVTWTSFSTNTVGAGPLYVVDTNSPLSMKRFYRVLQP